MSRIPSSAALGFAVGCLFLAGLACEEDGHTVPERCTDPQLPAPYNILTAGAPDDDNRQFNKHTDPNGQSLPPCITEVGHTISSVGGNSPSPQPTPTEGGDSSGGSGGSGGTKTSGGSGGTKSSGGTAGKGSGGTLNLAGVAGVAGIGGKK